METVKINLPATEREEEAGNGEGCFAQIDGAAVWAYDNDETGGLYLATLDNDSCYYPNLKHGDTVVITMRGTHRPIVPLEFLENNY